jgi:hypothetical protein
MGLILFFGLIDHFGVRTRRGADTGERFDRHEARADHAECGVRVANFTARFRGDASSLSACQRIVKFPEWTLRSKVV